MKRHERAIIVDRAEKEFMAFLIDWRDKHKCTPTEEMQIHGRRQQTLLKFALRYERHQDYSKAADERYGDE